MGSDTGKYPGFALFGYFRGLLYAAADLFLLAFLAIMLALGLRGLAGLAASHMSIISVLTGLGIWWMGMPLGLLGVTLGFLGMLLATPLMPPTLS